MLYLWRRFADVRYAIKFATNGYNYADIVMMIKAFKSTKHR